MELQATIRRALDNGDARANPRRQLNLKVGAREPTSSRKLVTVRNLSTSGLLIETDEKLSIGDAIEIELPVAGNRLASVVWTSSNLCGCKFSKPISQGSVSAALLRSPIEVADWPAFDPDAGDDPELRPKTVKESNALSITLKFWIIVGLTIASWGLVGGLVMLLVYLLDLL